MGIFEILRLIAALPSLIKLIMDVINAIRGVEDPHEKIVAEAEFDAIKQEILRKKRVGLRERERLESLKVRLKK